MKSSFQNMGLALAVVISGSFGCASSNSSGMSSSGAASAAASELTIPEVAMAAGEFNTLVAALKAAELVETLKGDGPFTVFAPNDDAFAKLPAGTVESLLKDKEKLTAILTYHVVAGKVMAADVGGLSEAKTLNGKMVSVDTSAGVKIGSATVIKTDIGAKNGVIHVIDTVLIPE